MLANSHCSCILPILAMQETCKTVGVYMAACPACRKSFWHAMTCPMHRKCEWHAINPVPVLAQESVQEILPYTASWHVMEILNYPAQGYCRVQDLWPFLYQYWYRKVYRKLCPIATSYIRTCHGISQLYTVLCRHS